MLQTGWRGLGVKLYVLEGQNALTRSGVGFVRIVYSDSAGKYFYEANRNPEVVVYSGAEETHVVRL